MYKNQPHTHAVNINSMRIAKVTFILTIMFCFNHSYAQSYQLHGRIKGTNNGWAFLWNRQSGQIDSSIIKNGHFTFSGSIAAPEFCTFGFSTNGVKDYYLSFFLETGKFKMVVDKD